MNTTGYGGKRIKSSRPSLAIQTGFQKTKGRKSERETDQLTNLNSYVSVKDTKQTK